MMVEQPKESLGEHWEKKRANENLVAPSLVGQGTDKNLAKRARARLPAKTLPVSKRVNSSKADADYPTLIDRVIGCCLALR
jgi:hypothetical protein